MKYAVIDSGPLIKGIRLEMLGADTFITVPEVLLEIRDRQTRDRIEALPFELETREPSSESIDAIRQFAKLTGDLPALSSVDVRVLALAWMLEKETKSGVEHLRTTPLPPGARTRGARVPAAEDASTSATASGSGALPDESAATDCCAADAMEEEEPKEGAEKSSEDIGEVVDGGAGGAMATGSHKRAAEEEPEDVPEDATAELDEESEALLASLSSEARVDLSDSPVAVSSADQPAADATAAQHDHQHDHQHEHDHASEREAARAARAEARRRAEAAEAGQLAGSSSSRTAARQAEEPWITVDNLKSMQRRDGQRYAYAPDASTTVACLTTDYAMQSVLMQMGLKLVGADGMLLRSVKQWVLRCSGCFTQQSSLEAQFCSKCGNMSLVRLQAVLDSRGQQRILPEERAPARVRSTNIRGTKFPLPAPKTGRHAQNLILAEDQFQEAADKMRRQGKARVEDVFDPDYSLDDHFGRVGKKKGGMPQGPGVPKVGYGKRANPNDVRSRPKRS